MSAVSETIVREFFELHGFLVRQQRKYIAPNRRDEESVDLFVLNPAAEPAATPLPFVLMPVDLARLQRAIVVVIGWHTEKFSPGVVANAPEIARFVQPAVFKRALKSFGVEDSLTKILVLPALPSGQEARDQSIALLRSKGIDAVLPFHTMLSNLIEKVEVNRNYQKSDLLQIIRILKNYAFFKEPQLELFKAKRKRRTD